MKVRIKTKSIKSTKLIMPVDGLVEINADGIAEVSEKCAEIMVNKTNSWEMVDGAVEAETEAPETEAPETEEAEAETAEETRADFEKKIRLMKFEKLKEFAIESGCDENEVNSITSKKEMVNYLLNQYDSAE